MNIPARFRLHLLPLIVFAAAPCPAAPPAEELPRAYSIPAAGLARARERLRAGDASLAPAFAALRERADAALKLVPRSVMDKARTPPSGDKHDYLSQAPYWWPDPSRPGGLPYRREDGRHNPEADRGVDADSWAHTAGAVETLGLAYYFTGHVPYAAKAAVLVRTWFLDPATRMNPRLDYAQFIPGRNDGRGAGVLEMRHLARVCDALALIRGSGAWPADDDRAFRAWLEAYFKWLTESPNGRAEASAPNNHGSWYDVQAAHIALVLGRTDFARQLLLDGRQKRIARQIEPDGRQPLELVRTKSLGYCLFNLGALFNLARLGEAVGVDWWDFRTPDGRSLSVALDRLAPMADPAQPWSQKDLESPDRGEILALLAEALRHHPAVPQWRALLDRFGASPRAREARWHLLLAE